MPEEPYVFVSYASADRERVLPVVDRLTAGGVSVWIDREGIHGGANYGVEITAAIEQASALLLFCSPASLASRNVRQEIALGWRFEKPYIPLLLDPVEIPKDLAYWLEGCQWIELLDRSDDVWLSELAQALAPLGITLRRTSATVGEHERPRLVGRERERGVLRAMLGQMLAGRGGVALVGGEAGIGKTTLVTDLSIQAEEAGALVLWGHAYDLSVTPPYGPWLEIMRHYRAIATGLPPVPAFVESADALARVGSQETLFAAVADFFADVAAQRPLLLVLDDLHWADQASLDFLRHLSRQVAQQRLLLVATYRTEELHPGHPLHALLPLLVREAAAVRVDVQPLDERACLDMIESRYQLAKADEERLERYLQQRAEGNPFYAGELLRTLEEERILTRGEHAWTLGDLEQTAVPALLRQVIERRVGRLDAESQRLLAVAAVVGQTVPLGVWAQVGGVDEDALLDLAERAEEAKLLRGTPEGDGVQFDHALIREALYEGIPSLRRRRLHRQVAEALAARRNPDPSMVAHHFEEASDERAVDWLIRAGERAQQLFVPADAIAHFNTAEQLAQQQGRPLPATFYRARGLAESLIGSFDAARADFETALRLAHEAGDQHIEWQALVDLGLLWASRDYTRSGGYLQQALTLARSMDAPALLGHSLNRVGNWYLNAGRTVEAIRDHQEALTIFERLEDRAGLAATSDLLGLSYFLSGDLVLGTAHYRRAVELFRAIDDRTGLASSLGLLADRGVNYQTDTMVVDPDPPLVCERDAREALAIAREIGWRAGESFALSCLTFCTSGGGYYDRALESAAAALSVAEDIEHQQWLAMAHSAGGMVYLSLLALPQAREHLQKAMSYARAIGSHHWDFVTTGIAASALIANGELAQAETELVAVLAADSSAVTMGERLAWSARVELLLARGEAEATLPLLDRMVASSPNVSPERPVPRYAYLRGLALLALNRLDEAEAALRDALRVVEPVNARPWIWRIRRELGRVYQARQQPDRAVAEFAVARAMVEELAAELSDAALRQTFLDGAASLLPAQALPDVS